MFKYVEAKDEELIKKIYRFRCQIACDELQVLKREDYTDGLEIDEYDQYSIHFAALNQQNEVMSCLRLIHHSPIGYPMDKMEIEKDLSHISRENLGEISRIFIHESCRDMKSTKEIFRLTKKYVCPKMVDLGLTYTFGALEKSFHRLLNMFGMPYEIIGRPQMHGGRYRYPSLLSTKKLIAENPDICNKWMNYE